MLKRGLGVLRSYTAVCLCCQSWAPPVRGLCDPCWKIILGRPSPRVSQLLEYPFRLYPRWEWLPGDGMVTDLLRYLKGGGPDSVFQKVAVSLLVNRMRVRPLEAGVLVPVPSRTERSDHADQLAKALGAQLGWPVLAPLRRLDRSAQKMKTRHLRKGLKIQNAGETLSVPVILVDDVITTGATVEACYKALGEPKSFEVWAVACRPKTRLL